MPLSPDQITERKQQAVQMRGEQAKHKVKLDELRTRFKCTGQEAFQVLQGMDLESPLRDQIYQYFCGEPGQGLRIGHQGTPPTKPVLKIGTPESLNPLPGQAPSGRIEPKPPEVVDLISRPSDPKPPRPPVGEPYKVPTPDPVPPVEVTLREDAPAIAQPGENILAPAAEETPATTPAATPATAKPALGSNRAALADPEVGARIRVAMQTAGYSAGQFAKQILGHSSGSNVSAALGRSGSRSLQDRMCDLLALDHEGRPIPGKTHKLPPANPTPAGKPPTVPTPAAPPMKVNEAVFLAPEKTVTPPPTHGDGRTAITAKSEEKPAGKDPRDVEIGRKIAKAIEESGYTVRLVAWHLGHQNAANVARCLSGHHCPELQLRLTSLMGLSPDGGIDWNHTRNPAHALPPAETIRPPQPEIDPATAVAPERADAIAQSLDELSRASRQLTDQGERYKEAQERYKKALAAVNRLGISAKALRIKP